MIARTTTIRDAPAASTSIEVGLVDPADREPRPVGRARGGVARAAASPAPRDPASSASARSGRRRSSRRRAAAAAASTSAAAVGRAPDQYLVAEQVARHVDRQVALAEMQDVGAGGVARRPPGR